MSAYKKDDYLIVSRKLIVALLNVVDASQSICSGSKFDGETVVTEEQVKRLGKAIKEVDEIGKSNRK